MPTSMRPMLVAERGPFELAICARLSVNHNLAPGTILNLGCWWPTCLEWRMSVASGTPVWPQA
eukprot:687610-Alexandrium_andersonii.AAC.1